MRGKQRKQMLDERYKVKYGAVAERLGPQRVLLPLSLGISSVVLLDMIASLLQEQILGHKGKQGFELVVVHVEEATSDLDTLYELVGRYDPVQVRVKVLKLDDYLVDSAWVQTLQVSPEFDVMGLKISEDSTSVAQMLAMSPSRSLRADLLAIVYQELILRTAVAEKCQTILFGHCMTRLANEVISLTVKGRGLEIHEAIADRTLTFGGHEIHIVFPLRDILFAEVEAVLKLSGLLQFVAVVPEQSRIVKNMTVQALTTQYFQNLDATGYASTASTVVKTAEKLGGPKESKSAVCRICGGDIHKDPRLWLSNITVSRAAPLETDEERAYAKEYEAAETVEAEGDQLSVCYGCTVTLAGAGPGFVWPVTKQEILDEYVLSEEE